MVRLILKDFIIHRNKLLSSCLTVFLISAVFPILTYNYLPKSLNSLFPFSGMIFVLVLLAIAYSFIDCTFVEDEKNGIVKLLTTLPFPRSILVYSKYASILIVVCLATSVYFASNVLSGFFIPPSMMKAISENTIIVMIFSYGASFFFIAIFLPLYYKYGYEKASFFTMFSVLLIPLMAAPISTVVKYKNWREYLIEKITDLNTISAFISAVVIILVAYFISMALSVSFFRKRDIF